LTYISDYKFVESYFEFSNRGLAPWAEILMVQGWWGGWPRYAEGTGADRIQLSDCLNQPAWFVSTLWLFTIATPFLERLLLFTQKRALAALLFFCVAVYPVVNPLCNIYPIWDRIFGRTEYATILLRGPAAPFAYLNQFLAGMVLGKLVRVEPAASPCHVGHRTPWTYPLPLTGLLCLTTIVCTMWLIPRYSAVFPVEFFPPAFRPMDAGMLLAPMLLLIWGLAQDADLLGALFSSRWLNWADQAAFGVYMLQVPFGRACELLGVLQVKKGTDCGTVFCMLGILTLIGLLAHRLVEAPLVSRLQRCVDRLAMVPTRPALD
jgi:peptidoglycan/LPS O-acetylase OafA/YrhL